MPSILTMVGMRVGSCNKNAVGTRIKFYELPLVLLVFVADLRVFGAGTLDLEEVWVLRQAECRIEDLAGFFTGRNAGNDWAKERSIAQLQHGGAYFIAHGVDAFIVESAQLLINFFGVGNISVGRIQTGFCQRFLNQLIISAIVVLAGLFFTVQLVAKRGVELINLGWFFGSYLGKDACWSPRCLHHVGIIFGQVTAVVEDRE